MKKIIAWLLVLALTATVSIGATLAYLTDTDEDVNVMTLGKVKIDQLEYERIDDESANEEADVQEFHDNKPLYPAVTEDGFDYTPGDSYVDWEQIGKEDYPSEIWDPTKINNEIDKMVFVKNKGDYDAYVRSVFAFEANGYTLEQFKELFHLNINTTDWTWEWEKDVIAIPNEEGGTTTTNYIVATATYNKVLKPGELTEISLSQIALDSSATNEDIEGFGDTYQVLVYSQGIQADGFDDPATALNEGFGEISTVPDSVNIPWVDDNPINGIDLRTALHYYEGNKSNQITAKVTNVIYALNEEYPEIIAEYDGTLVDIEQDVPVYAYYVPSGTGTYDVYFLANDTIYSPKDSSTLYYQMSALKTVDTGNYDVSRVQTMSQMFQDCTKLAVLDVSDWDTSNVTNMYQTFRNCQSLVVDVADWDVSNVTDMYCMFLSNYAMVQMDVSKWDVSSVENMQGTFYKCTALQTLDVSKWDMSNVTIIKNMFAYCKNLYALDVSDWDTSSITDMTQAFMSCTALEALEVGDWDVSKVTRFKATFGTLNQNASDMKFAELDVENWDVSSATDFEAMFYGCGQLTSLDLSKWDVSNVTKMPHMFCDCRKLKTINMSTWNTESLTCMDAMFNDCDSLEVVDLSSFSTGKVREFSQLFESCEKLEQIIGIEKFDTSSGQDFSEMFSGCSSLKELDLSGFDTRNANQDYTTYWPWYNNMFISFLSGCNSLEKITFGPYFSYDGDGSAKDDCRMKSLPAATGVEGWDGYWYNVDTGVAYLPSEIPEETAATYVAVKPATTTTPEVTE